MTERVCVLAGLVCLAVLAGGCGGYGDESSEEIDTRPPLIQIQDVNEWLTAYTQQHGTPPKTYEDVKAAYEATGKKWPPFPSGGSWVYFPHRARVIEVREAWAHGWLSQLTDKLRNSGQYLYSMERVAQYFRSKEGISVHCPGYKIVLTHHGSQSTLRVAYTKDGTYPIRGNHTATKAFDISDKGTMEAVPGGVE